MKDILSSKRYLQDIKIVLNNLNLDAFYNKKFLITGGLGLICSAIIDLLICCNQQNGSNIKIYLADYDQNGFYERYNNTDNVEYILYDATQPINFDINVDYIIHAAGISNPSMYVSKPVATLTSNILGVYNLLKYAHLKKAKRLLYISSSEIYGIQETGEAFKEGFYGYIDIDNVRSSYPIGKRAAEMLCKAFVSEYGVDCVIVRPGHIFGPTASVLDKRVSSEFAYLAAKGKDLELKSNGLQKRSYMYCLDCAAAILVCLMNGVCGESYNIANDETTSIAEMAKIYAQCGGVKLNYIEPNKKDIVAFNPMSNSTLNNLKLKQIGYKSSFCSKEGFEHTVEILRELIDNND